MFYSGQLPVEFTKRPRFRAVKVEKNILDKNYEQVFTLEEVETIYKARCLDCQLDFAKMGQQLDKFKAYAAKYSVNKKIILTDLQLSFHSASCLVELLSV
jgi:hypothetical protein